jgi:hypothetical protein
MNDTTLCTQCVLPATFPQIQFDAQGVCNFCRQGEAPHKQKFNDRQR